MADPVIEGNAQDPRAAEEGGISRVENAEIDAQLAGATPEQIAAAQRQTTSTPEEAPRPKGTEGKRKAQVTFTDGTSATMYVNTKEELDSAVEAHEVSIRSAQHQARVTEENAAKADNILSRVIETPHGSFDQTPVGAKETSFFSGFSSIGGIGGAGAVPIPQGGEVQSDNETKLLQQFAAKGGDVTTGAPADVRFLAGALSSKDKNVAPHILNEYVKQQYRDEGVDYPEGMAAVFLDRETGKIFYNRVVTQASVDAGVDKQEDVGGIYRTLVNDMDVSAGDMAEYFIDTADVVAEAGGAIGAAAATGAATKNPYIAYTASTALAGTIAGLSVPVRNGIIKHMTGMTDEEIADMSDPDEALHKVMWAVGGETAGVAVIQAVRAVRQSGRILKDKEAVDTIIDASRQQVKVWNDLEGLGIPVVRPSAGATAVSASQRARGAGAELAVFAADSARRLSPKNKVRAEVQNLSARQNLDAGLMEVTNRAVSPSTSSRAAGLEARQGIMMPKGSIGEETVEETAAILNKSEIDRGTGPSSRQDFADDAITKEEQRARATAQATKSGKVTLAREKKLLKELEAEVDKAHVDHKDKWGKVDSITGVDETNPLGNLRVNNPEGSPVREALSVIEARGGASLSKAVGNSSNKLVEDLQRLKEGTLDFHSLQELDSKISHEIRKANNNNPNLQMPFAARDLQDIQVAINKQIDLQDYSRMPRQTMDKELDRARPTPVSTEDSTLLHDAYREANQATAYYRQVAQRDSVEGILEAKQVFKDGKPTGKFKFAGAPHATIQDMLNSPRAVMDVLDFSGHLPSLKAGLSEELLGIYKRSVIDDTGQWGRGAHNAFMDKYADQAAMLWGKGESATLRNLESVTKAADRTAGRAMEADKLFARNFGDEFAKEGGATVDNMTTHFLAGNTKPSQVVRILKEVEKVSPDMAHGIRAEYAQKMMDEIAGKAVGLDPAKLTKYIQDKGEVTSAVLGKQYVKDLQKFADASKILDDSVSHSATSGLAIQAPWLALTRSMLGSLSKKQRFLTAYNRISRGYGSQKALEIMADPDQLRRLMRLEKMNPTSRAAQAEILRLGLEGEFGSDAFKVDDRAPITMKDLQTLKGMHNAGDI